MDYRYAIVNECLVLVRQGNMSVRNKLCLETLLYTMKRLLLAQERSGQRHSDHQQFLELLGQVTCLCKENTVTSVTGVSERMNAILTDLSATP